jgi:microcin C transport system permease protein
MMPTARQSTPAIGPSAQPSDAPAVAPELQPSTSPALDPELQPSNPPAFEPEVQRQFSPASGPEALSPATIATPSISPGRRGWLRFKRNRRGYRSLWIFSILFVLSLGAELLSNDRPIIARHDGTWYVPLLRDYPEITFGGDFRTQTDWLDPFIRAQFERPGNLALWPPNHYRFDTLNYFAPSPNPAAPSAVNWFGTDDRGRDVLARLIYGFRLSVLFGLALTAIGIVLGIVLGAIQGYFAGRTDLILQRLIEVWSSIPELYLLLILASVFDPSIWILLAILSLFGWMGLSDYVRAEFLRNRSLEYVTAARALGLRDRTIIARHVLPNSLTPVIAFLPFRMSAAIVALTSLDFLGLGVPSSTPSLGELLAQGKANLDAWWISLPTFAVLVGTLLLLIFIGEALRDALDTRRG